MFHSITSCGDGRARERLIMAIDDTMDNEGLEECGAGDEMLVSLSRLSYHQPGGICTRSNCAAK